uniref:Uncharacterized protein n=1 Tax=Nothobranchius furzeri TaxID=105023 RepID=A0A8C6PSZ2_NOTFU
MATTDSGVKPLQNAMKMAKTAIQLDGDNKHKVDQQEHKPEESAGSNCRQ